MYAQKDIEAYLKTAAESSQYIALAILVSKEGSSYSAIGRMMLVDESQHTFGILSGGCLESHINAQAAYVLEEKSPRLLNLDTTNDDDKWLGYNMGCKGKIGVLLTPIKLSSHNQSLIKSLLSYSTKDISYALCIETGGFFGSLCIQIEKSSVEFIEGHKYPAKLRSELINAFDQTRAAVTRKIGDLTLFLNYRPKRPVIKIFGAGVGTGYLVRLLQILGFENRVYDYRQGFMGSLTSELGIQCTFLYPKDIINATERGDYWVIMSHNYQVDTELVSHLLQKDCCYIGLLASSEKADLIKSEASKLYPNITFENFYSPIGINLGNNSPEAIALAIASEITLIMNNNSAFNLRDSHESSNKDSSNYLRSRRFPSTWVSKTAN